MGRASHSVTRPIIPGTTSRTNPDPPTSPHNDDATPSIWANDKLPKYSCKNSSSRPIFPLKYQRRTACAGSRRLTSGPSPNGRTKEVAPSCRINPDSLFVAPIPVRGPLPESLAPSKVETKWSRKEADGEPATEVSVVMKAKRHDCVTPSASEGVAPSTIFRTAYPGLPLKTERESGLVGAQTARDRNFPDTFFRGIGLPSGVACFVGGVIALDSPVPAATRRVNAPGGFARPTHCLPCLI